jgi:hypothetical protein
VQLSAHFTLSEMIKSPTALRLGIENEADEGVRERLRLLCVHLLEPIRARWGPVVVNSAFRCPALNAAVGGKPTSQHLLGEAADIEAISIDNFTLWRWVRDNAIYDQAILEHYDSIDPRSGWVHVSWSKERNRREAFRVGGGR